MKMRSVLAFVLVVVLMMSLCTPAMAANTKGVTFTATLNNSTLNVSNEDQVVTVTVNASKEITWDGIGFKAYYDSPLVLTNITNKEVTLTAGDIQVSLGSGDNGAGYQTADGENSTITNICVLHFKVPANTPAGTYDLGIQKLEITSDYGDIWENSATAMTTLTIEETVAPGPVAYTATASKSEFDVSAEDQTLTVTVNANQQITWDGIGFKAYYDSPLVLTNITNKEVTLTAGDIQVSLGSGDNGAGYQTADGENSTITNICVLHFTIPANTPAGTYNLGIQKLEITKDYGDIWEANATAMTAIEIKGAAHTCSGTKQTGKAATCTVDGWNDYYSCTCGKNYTDAACTNEIADLAAWKTGAGKIAASHDYGTLVEEDPGKHTATEVKDGMKAHYFCDTCDTYFDSSKVATTKEALTIKKEHNYTAQYGYKEDDGHANVCACGAHDTVVAHTPNITAPTENDDQVCTVCEYVIAPKLGHIHQNNLTAKEEETAYCFETGVKAYYACTCGKYFEDATAHVEIADLDEWKQGAGKIPMTPHNYTFGKDEESLCMPRSEAANCTEFDTYWYKCEACGKDACDDPDASDKYWTSTKAGDHSFVTTEWGYTDVTAGHAHKCEFCGEHDEIKPHTPNMDAPTEDADKICSECQIVLEPATGHLCGNHLTKVPAQTADCENDGNIEYYTCACGKWYEDATATTEITDKESVKIAGGHKYGTLVAAQPEVHTATELKAAVAAHYFCDACDTYFTEGKVATTLDALTGEVPTHNYATVNGYKGEDGHANTCACGAKDTVTAHTPNITAPTEDDDQVCTVCEYVIAPKLGHIHTNNLTKVPAQTADCENDGNIEYYTCSCGKWFADATASVEITDKESVKIAGGHDYGTLIAAEPEVHTSTELKAGVAAHYFCDACDTYFTEGKVATTLDALTGEVPTHNYATVNGYKGEDGHANTCSCGAKGAVTAHTPDREEATEEHAVLCTECGYEIAPALPHTHRPTNEIKSDKKNHWNLCACGEKVNVAPHVDADEDKACDVCDRDLTPSVTPETGDNSNVALWISLMVISAFGVAIAVVGKKRYSVK